MRVSVLFFARLRELAGCHEWVATLAEPATVADAWRAARTAHPALEPFAGSVSAAVNTDFAPMTSALDDGDTVAFLPPVSGGALER